jgi:hypothetical protein
MNSPPDCDKGVWPRQKWAEKFCEDNPPGIWVAKNATKFFNTSGIEATHAEEDFLVY